MVLAAPKGPLVKLDDKFYKLVDKMEALVAPQDGGAHGGAALAHPRGLAHGQGARALPAGHQLCWRCAHHQWCATVWNPPGLLS